MDNNADVKGEPFMLVGKRVIIDNKISYGAKGVYAYLLYLNKTYKENFQIEEVYKNLQDERAIIKCYLNELVNYGYLEVKDYYEKKNKKFIGCNYSINGGYYSMDINKKTLFILEAGSKAPPQ